GGHERRGLRFLLEEQGVSALEQRTRLDRQVRQERCLPRLIQQRRLCDALFGELGRAAEIPVRLGRRCERRGALARARQCVARLGTYLRSVVGVRKRFVSGDVVRRDHLGDLVLAEALLEVRRGGEMTCPPFAARKRLVRDVTDEVLKKTVLAMLGRARVGLERKHLLADEPCEEGAEVRAPASAEGRQPSLGDSLAEHVTALQPPALLRRAA